MDTQEIDSTLDELESRLDRLRSLYEQYFLGIEKIEPAVARKDVDRRFWMLRRVQIRNTARRWRLQVLIQRYNTFQQYWTRICREIENGTYVRHLLKAKKNLGAEPKTWAAKKRLGLLRKDRLGQGAEAATEETPEGAGVDAAAQLDGGLGSADDPDASDLDAPGAARRNGGPPPPRASRPQTNTVTLTLDDLGPLDLDFDDEPTPPPRVAAKPVSATPGRPAPGGVIASGAAALGARPPGAAAPGAHPPGAARPPASPWPRPPAAAPAGGVGGVPARPSPPRSPGVAPEPRPRAPLPAAAPGAPGVVAAPAAARPPLPAPARPPLPAPAPAAPRPAAAAGGSASTLLSEDRVRTLHAELVAARRQLNQGDNVSMDSLAKSLRETERKLRAQHGGRSVDFQIVVKDGKPVVKPVVRK